MSYGVFLVHPYENTIVMKCNCLEYYFISFLELECYIIRLLDISFHCYCHMIYEVVSFLYTFVDFRIDDNPSYCILHLFELNIVVSFVICSYYLYWFNFIVYCYYWYFQPQGRLAFAQGSSPWPVHYAGFPNIVIIHSKSVIYVLVASSNKV